MGLCDIFYIVGKEKLRKRSNFLFSTLQFFLFSADFRSPGLVLDVGENGLSIFAQIESLNTKFMDPQLQLKMDQTQGAS